MPGSKQKPLKRKQQLIPQHKEEPMARTRRTISLDEKIEKAQAAVFRQETNMMPLLRN